MNEVQNNTARVPKRATTQPVTVSAASAPSAPASMSSASLPVVTSSNVATLGTRETYVASSTPMSQNSAKTPSLARRIRASSGVAGTGRVTPIF